MTSKIEQELQKATGVKPKKGESRQGYLHRLAKEAFDKLPDATFNKLSKAAQGWVNDASEEWDEAVERGLKETDAKLAEFPDAEKEPAVAEETKDDGAATIAAEDGEGEEADAEDEDEDTVAQKKGKAAPKKTARKVSARAKAQEKMAAKAKETKAPAKKAAKANGATRSRVDPNAKIKLLVKENPKRGEKSKKAFALYRDGMTVGEFLKKGGTSADISWDTRHDFIKLT